MNTKNNNNFVKIVALIIVTILWLGAMVGLTAYAYQEYITANAAPNTTDIELNIPVPSTVIMPDTSNEDNAKRVFMDDSSGSAEDIFPGAKLDYDVVVPFSTYLWQKDAHSHIISCVYNALTIVDELGVGTDLESYPANESNAVKGMVPHKDKEVIIYMSEDCKPEYYQNAANILSKLLDPATCTLKFVDYLGNTYATIYDNYKADDTTAVTAPVVQNQEIKVNISTPAPATTGFTRTDVAVLAGLLFTIIFALIVVIICMTGRDCYTQIAPVAPTAGWQGPVGTAVANGDAVVCDFSGSMNNMKNAVCAYIRNLGVQEVWTFNDRIKTIPVIKALKKSTAGGTSGYKMICHLHSQNVKSFVLVSDMCFNDNPTDFNALQPGTFDHITFVIPKNISKEGQQILEKVKDLANSTTIAYLEN